MKPSRLRRWLKRLAVLAVLLVAGWLAASAAVAYKLTRRPRPPYAEAIPPVPWGVLESLRLRTSDGIDLGAWFTLGTSEGPSVVLLHGYNGSRKDSLPQMEMLVRAECSVLAITLRSHGDSGGEGNDVGYSARHDVVAAVDYLAQRRPRRPIFIDGTSLGAAAAIYAGGELQTRVAGYILECPFRDIHSAVWNRTRAFLTFPLDDIAYAGLDLMGPIFLPEIDRMSPADRIAEIPASVPLLIMAGGRDNRARPEEVEAIYRHAAAHARMIVFSDAPHGQFCLTGGTLYRDAVLEMLHVDRTHHAPP
jgi:uncharacterized protein